MFTKPIERIVVTLNSNRLVLVERRCLLFFRGLPFSYLVLQLFGKEVTRIYWRKKVGRAGTCSEERKLVAGNAIEKPVTKRTARDEPKRVNRLSLMHHYPIIRGVASQVWPGRKYFCCNGTGCTMTSLEVTAYPVVLYFWIWHSPPNLNLFAKQGGRKPTIT